MSLDRGYGHIQAQEKLAQLGIYTNAMMQMSRIGLPRVYLSELAKDLGSCGHVDVDEIPRACTHAPDAQGCRKFCFTALHKSASDPGSQSASGAEWELALWEDSMLMVAFTNFFSTSRCGLLTRGGARQRDSFSIWAPEAVWHYNVQGRSATDGADQLRKKLCLAERRICRIGNKGISFVFDIMFTNAAIMWQFLQPATTKPSKLRRDFTKV